MVIPPRESLNWEYKPTSIRFMTVPYHGEPMGLWTKPQSSCLLMQRVRCMTAYGWTRRREQQQKAIHRFQASRARFHRCTCKTCRCWQIPGGFIAFLAVERWPDQLDNWTRCGAKVFSATHLMRERMRKKKVATGSSCTSFLGKIKTRVRVHDGP